jgi:hypothetical protein
MHQGRELAKSRKEHRSHLEVNLSWPNMYKVGFPNLAHSDAKTEPAKRARGVLRQSHSNMSQDVFSKLNRSTFVYFAHETNPLKIVEVVFLAVFSLTCGAYFFIIAGAVHEA